MNGSLNFSVIKPTDALICQIYFGYKMNLYVFQAVLLPIISSSLTAHLALVYVIRFEGSFRAGTAGPARKLMR